MLMIPRHAPLRAITWGTAKGRAIDGSEARIVETLVEKYGIRNDYLELDAARVDPEVVLDRFVEIGEGRIDRIGGSVDGMRLWEQLCEDGFAGIFRGDEALGWVPVNHELGLRGSVGLNVVEEFGDLLPFSADIGAAWGRQVLPDGMPRWSGESLAAWRDRLYQSFRTPAALAVLAALTPIKSEYMEISAPLLSGELVKVVREMPDSIRTDKRAFRRWVAKQRTGVPFATKDSTPSVGEFLHDRRVVELLTAELLSADAAPPPHLLEATVQRMAAPPSPSTASVSWRSSVKRSPPDGVKQRVARRLVRPPAVDWHRIGFRLYLTSRMDSILQEDARLRPGP